MIARNMLIGIGIGATAAFIADPRTGRRRRALVRDQFVRAGRKTRDAFDATARDLANRTTGILAATRSRVADEPVGDRQLAERVRSALGRACSHPRAIDVEASEGTVALRGPILSNEVENLLAAVRVVPGVRGVTNELEPHASSDGVPALQGEGRFAAPALDILQPNWAPATQALVAAAGVLATIVCIATYARR